MSAVEIFLKGSRTEFNLISPQAWKYSCELKGKDKDDSRLLAIKKFPFLAGKLKRKKDVDRAEALLIALYEK